MGGKGKIFSRRAIMLALALLAIVTFSVGKVAECAGAFGAESTVGATAAGAGQAHNEFVETAVAGDEPAEIEPALTWTSVSRCHHGAGHVHKGAGSKVYASPRQVADQLPAVLAGPDLAAWTPISLPVLLGMWWPGSPLRVSRSSPPGRQILISECVART